MRVLSLDISSHAGWALLEGEPGSKPELLKYGLIDLPQSAKSFGPYPWGYVEAAEYIASALYNVTMEHTEIPVIVIEETNLGKQRYSQKLLEWIHLSFLWYMAPYPSVVNNKNDAGLVYISSSSWRKTLGVHLSSEQRKMNAKVSKAKQKSKKADGTVDLKKFNAEKKKLGVKGRINWKKLSVDFVNDPERGFGLNLKAKDNDISDAILLGYAYFMNAPVCDGVTEG